MVSVCKLGGTINQTGVKGGKSKRSKIPPQSLSFSFSLRPRFSRFAAHHSLLVRSRDIRSIALKTRGKERGCSQSIDLEKFQSLGSSTRSIDICTMYAWIRKNCTVLVKAWCSYSVIYLFTITFYLFFQMLVLATFFPTSDVSPGYMDFIGVGFIISN